MPIRAIRVVLDETPAINFLDIHHEFSGNALQNCLQIIKIKNQLFFKDLNPRFDEFLDAVFEQAPHANIPNLDIIWNSELAHNSISTIY